MTLFINGKTYEADELIAYVKKLEKENAELKRDKEDLIFIRNQNAKCMCEDKENLTKAKELLKQWLQTSRASGCDNINIVTDTEQFISEVEK